MRLVQLELSLTRHPNHARHVLTIAHPVKIQPQAFSNVYHVKMVSFLTTAPNNVEYHVTLHHTMTGVKANVLTVHHLHSITLNQNNANHAQMVAHNVHGALVHQMQFANHVKVDMFMIHHINFVNLAATLLHISTGLLINVLTVLLVHS